MGNNLFHIVFAQSYGICNTASIQLQVPVAETSNLRLVDLQASGIDVLTELNAESQVCCSDIYNFFD